MASKTPLYKLRPEQLAAVEKTLNYYKSCGNFSKPAAEHISQNLTAKSTSASSHKFLWNAKPRFGKTLAAYDFAKKISAKRILIITNRPSISDSWVNNYREFIAPNSDYIFASSKSTPGVYSRTDLIKNPELLSRPLIFFISLQDLKGREKTSQNFKSKNHWIFEVEKPWDLVIIDEEHEGIRTDKTFAALSKIRANFTLHLSGTPFRAVADREFSSEQIFNWTYLDEQSSAPKNPHLEFYLSTLENFTGSKFNSLSEFFETKNGSFVHAAEVNIFLDRLVKDFAGPLRHSFWLCSSIAECKAMSSALKIHPYFKGYEIIMAAGQQDSKHPEKLLSRIRDAISSEPLKTRTITLSCGRLTTGITIPEWGSVVMLQNSLDLDRVSSSAYLQAAFRAQNPCEKLNKSAGIIIDFLPERALTILGDYAKNLCRTDSLCRTDNPNSFDNLCGADNSLKTLLQYLPLHFLKENHWQNLSPKEAYELPHRLIAKEIVDSGFVFSDKLFNWQNLSDNSATISDLFKNIHSMHKNRLEKIPTKLAPLENLAAIERAVESECLKNYNLNNLPTAKIDAIMQETRREARRAARKKYHDTENLYRDKIRGFTRTIPLLLHVVGSKDNNYNFPKLAKSFQKPFIAFGNLDSNFSDRDFKFITGLNKREFHKLCSTNLFNAANCDLAIHEFLNREKNLSSYYENPAVDFAAVFDNIHMQRGNVVFTPYHLVQKICDQLELENPEIFRSKSTTFFDPVSKSGLFLAEITRRLYQNLRPKFKTNHDCLFHILSEQIYAWSRDKILLQSTMNTVLSPVRFGDIAFIAAEMEIIKNHFIEFNPENGNSSFNQAKITQKINKYWGKDMKFDVIIGNPPYQNGRRQVYADFYKLAVDLNPDLLCMVFPLGWQKVYNHNGLGQLNNPHYKRDPHIVSLDHYYETSDSKLFPELATGGVNIILRNKNHDNKGQIQKLEYGKKVGKMVLPLASSEIEKPSELTCLIKKFEYLPKMESLGSVRKPYGFHADPLRSPAKYSLILQDKAHHTDDVRLFGLLPGGSRGSRYIPRTSLPRTTINLDSYKLFVPKAWGNMSARIGLGGSYANICVAKPGDACSETFIEFGPFTSQDEAVKMAKYFMTKFFRALLFIAKDTQNTAKDKYKFIPVPDLGGAIWREGIDDLDEYLFNKYQVPEPSRKFIRDSVQPRSEANIDIL